MYKQKHKNCEKIYYSTFIFHGIKFKFYDTDQRITVLVMKS